MKIAIVSDSHNSLDNLRKALNMIKKKTKRIIHCGDLCSSFILNELEGFDVDFVFGNMSDRSEISKKLKDFENIRCHTDCGEIDFEGLNIAFVHEPEYAYSLAFSKKYDIIFYGHTHKYKVETIENSLVINPGEIMGRAENPGFIIFDSKTKEIERFELD